MGEFYRATWDDAERKDIANEVEQRKTIMPGARERLFEHLLERYSISKNTRILDIGSGYGDTLHHLQMLGFQALVGVEPSSHRAQVATRAFGLTILVSLFEDIASQGTFGLIWSHHVMEHVEDPALVVRKCADMQTEGGYLMFTVPNKEPVMYTLLFLPHLHRYTPYSLAALLMRMGYIIRDTYITDKEMTIIAQKHTSAQSVLNRRAFTETLNYFRDRLGMGKHWFSPRLMWWYRPLGNDEGGQLPYIMPSLLWRYVWHFHRKAPLQAAIVEDTPRITDAPLEIQFSGPVQMAYK